MTAARAGLGVERWLLGRRARRSRPLHGLRIRGFGREIREGEDRPERGPAGPIGARRGRGDAVADAVEAGNRAVARVEHLAVGGRLWAALGVEIPASHERGVEGAR